MLKNIETLEHCLKQINPALLEYDDWLKIGSAIKHEGGSVEMWDQWSATDQRYRKNDCRSRWANLDRGAEPVTIATIVKICKEQGGCPPDREFYDMPDKQIPFDLQIDLPQKKIFTGKILDKNWLELEELPEDSGLTGPAELALYLKTLFSNTEHVGYVSNAFQSDPDQEGKRKWLPAGKGIYTRTAGELLDEISKNQQDITFVIGDYELDCGAWIRFNPLDGKGIADANVTDYRYSLVESDDLSIKEQFTIYKKLELPIAALVSSGGKSLHAIVRIEAPDFKEYQKRVDFLYEICKKNGLAVDRKNRNPSRLSRMPGVYRKGKKQRLVGVNLGKSNWQEWADWIAALNDDLPEIENLSSVWGKIPDLSGSLIEGILRKGHKMLVSGPSKAGKSFLLLELMIAIAEGGYWLNWRCEQGKVLYVNLELDRASCLHRIKDIYNVKGITNPKLENVEIWNLRGKSLPMDNLAPRLIRRAMKENLVAVIIDPIYKVLTGDENSADQMAKFCNQFDKVCTELGCAVIYCHHHSKGDQGQKRLQDRASGSGVFARDPDALIDIVELSIDEKRREQITYKYQVSALQKLLDSEKPDWKKDLDLEEQERLEDILAVARKASNQADSVNAEAIKAASVMTGWKIGGILREYPAFSDQYAFFRYPDHLSGEKVTPLLQDCKAVGEIEHYQPKQKENREEKIDKAASAINETHIAFDALSIDGPVTTARIAEYMEMSERRARERLKKAGYLSQGDNSGIWSRKQ